MKHKDQVAEWAQGMFDLLVKNPDGLTRDKIMEDLDIPSVGEFHETKGLLQDLCGATDSLTIVGDSKSSMDGGWTWSIQANPSSPEAKGYQIRKMRGLFGRQYRSYMVAKALAKGTPGNAAVGRSVRRMQRSIYNSMVETKDALAELGADSKITLPAPPP